MEFVDIFKSSLPPKEKDINRKTAKNLCGIVIPIRGECSFSVNDKKYTIKLKALIITVISILHQKKIMVL
ncbi:hypothetical protein GNF77_15930 [Clostridium perfringens]|uniref:Uncharacterized protein n=1 Tax=Clostridium perfringens TaxID=1502 RepID=A0AAW9IQD4_CLOPF|nr:hypothetical protein [Clostridium perfringens]MDZ5010360.1 hypothetical protein [Clostridium perfringens]